MARREEYEGAARGIAAYLAERQRPDGGFPGPDNYGVACALWLWSHFGVEFVAQLHRAWERLKREPPTTHGEFNAYALLACRERLGTGPVDTLLRRLKLRGYRVPRGRLGEGPVDVLLRRLRLGRRHSANWMLLRAVCRSQPGPFFSPARGSWEARAALLRYARRGFIADRPGARSFTYHAFCGALLADLWRHRKAGWAARAAARAAHFMTPSILPNGDSLYVGRGQQQIFGYGALLYLLEAAAGLTGEEEFGALAERAFSRLMRFQRSDGSFPLVLREGEPAEPWLPEISRPGWYTYNRYADYLPLLGCFLLKAADPEVPPFGAVAPGSAHPAFRLWREDRYVAVLALPGGASTNDLAFPYVCLEGQSLFPCYGAEGAIAPEAAPLPYGVLGDGRRYGFRDQLRYHLTESGLVGLSSLVRHMRRLAFRADGFVCRDEILFRRRSMFSQFVPANFLFRTLRRLPGGEFETWHRGARASLEMEPEGAIHPAAGVSATGPLVALQHVMGRVEARAGDTISTELRVRFP